MIFIYILLTYQNIQRDSNSSCCVLNCAFLRYLVIVCSYFTDKPNQLKLLCIDNTLTSKAGCCTQVGAGKIISVPSTPAVLKDDAGLCRGLVAPTEHILGTGTVLQAL